jgi:toxin ParE1/3/4
VRLVWLPLSVRLRFTQLFYIVDRDPAAAVRVDEEIEQQTDMLIDHPEMGRTGRRPGTRELVVQRTPFVIVYRVRPKAKRVEILRVLHGAQKWPQ